MIDLPLLGELGENAWVTLVVVATELALQALMVVAVLVRKPSRPAADLAWILVIIVLPVLGMTGYLMFGEARLGRRRRERHREIAERTRKEGLVHGAVGLYPRIPRDLASITALASSVGGMPVRGGHAVVLMGDTEEVIEALVADIDGARLHCHLLFYIFLDDDTGTQVGEALLRAAGRGVAARLLVDGVGSRDFLGSELCRRLRQGGVSVVEALPASLVRVALARLDLRNHRKIAVIDGAVAYTGSQNIADAAFATKPSYGPWVDSMMRLEGPAVLDLQELFITDWYLDSDESLVDCLDIRPPSGVGSTALQIIPTGPGDHHESLRLICQSAFHLAREEILLTTPYFVPGEPEVAALCTAARRGVRTVLVVPRRNDSPLVAAASRSLYEPLMDAGVEIHEYTAGILHAKTMTVDRRLALIGTANFDRRSFELNFEVSALVLDDEFASRLRFLQRSYMNDTEQVDEAVWRRRPLTRRLVQNAAGVLAPLL